MNGKQHYRLFAWLVALLVAVALLPAAPTRAAASGTVEPPRGRPGTTFTFTASGFLAHEIVGVWLTDPQGDMVTIDEVFVADENGLLSWAWTAPETARGGTWYLTMRGNFSREEVAMHFVLEAPETPHAIASSYMIMPAPEGPPGTTFTFVARGQFSPGEQVGSWFIQPDGATLDVEQGISVDGSGQIYRQWQAPANAAPGQWFFQARGINSLYEVKIPFTIVGGAPVGGEPADIPAPRPEPGFTVSPEQGPRGTTFQLGASGFTPGERLGIWIITPDGTRQDYQPDTWIYADGQDGTYRWNWTAPADALNGAWQITIRGLTSRLEWAIPVTIADGAVSPTPEPGLHFTVSPDSAPLGTRFRFQASGYMPGETVFFWATDPNGYPYENAKEAEANAYGVVEWSWEVHDDKPVGAWRMSARGDASRKEGSVTFHVTGPDKDTIVVAPLNGAPGTTFAFEAGGFLAREDVEVWLDVPATDQRRYDQPQNVPLDLKADKNGFVSWEWIAPPQTAGGNWRMVVRGEDSRITRVATFTIVRDAPPPAVYGVYPQSGPPGTTFHFFANDIPTDRASYWVTAPDGTVITEMTDYRDWMLSGDNSRFEWTWTAPPDAEPGLWTMVIHDLADQPRIDPEKLFNPDADIRQGEKSDYDDDRIDSVEKAREFVIVFNIQRP